MSEKRKNSTTKYSHCVECIDLGIIFESVKEANKWLLENYNKSGNIYKACQGKYKKAGGFR